MKTLKQFLVELNKNGADTFYVGGYVRDKIMNNPNKDIDIEVHNISQEHFESILNKYTKVDLVGKSFGVYKANFDGQEIDLSFPRTERKIGDKHTDFEVNVNPYLSIKESSKRRDLTINSIYQNTLTNKLLDPFDGCQDIKNKIIRIVDEKTFVKDSLRVLRACRFASKFNFTIDSKTLNLMKTLNLNNLSTERIFTEFKKVKNFNIFFYYLFNYTQFPKVKYRKLKFKENQSYEVVIAIIFPAEFIYEYITNSKDIQELSEFTNSILDKESLEITFELYKMKDKYFDKCLEIIEVLYDKEKRKYIEKQYKEAQKQFVTGKEFLNIAQGKEIGRLVKEHNYNVLQESYRMITR